MHQITLFGIIFLLCIRKTLSSSSEDSHFTVCKQHKLCGNQPIKFPFYLNDIRENEKGPFVCGYPGFNLSCVEGQPILRLSDNDYVVKEIIYQNQSVRVSVAALSQHTAGKCIPPLQNTTFPSDKFTRSSDQSEVVLFYGCNESVRSVEKICSSGENNDTLAVMATGDSELLANVSRECGRAVKVPVEDEDYDGGGGIMEKLRRGFWMKWTATNCSGCEHSGGFCGFDLNLFFQFQCFCTDRPHFKACVVQSPSPRNNHLGLKLGIGIGVPGAIMIGLLIYSLHLIHKRKYGSADVYSANSSSYPSKSDPEAGSLFFGVPVFTYGELQKATNNFDHSKELGDGGFGTVYYGKLLDGREVAVKRLYDHNYKRVEQFKNEIEILTCLRHKNLVSLYGCTSHHSHELLLVYEFVPNGTVADHLHGDRANLGLLTWPIRMNIAIETASALVYLHASGIVHRDVKTNNILLDNNFSVKVADFGLSRLFPTDVTHVSTAPQGTPGYVDPEYHQCYQLTDKSDVYSFGVVLMELISSMPAVDISRHRHEINLSNLAINKIQKKAYDELVDPNLGFESDSSVQSMTIMVAELAFRCLQQDKEMRPSMDEVLEALQEIESGKFDIENLDNVRTGDIEVKSMHPPPSPECDDVGLLKKYRQPSSPISVTEKWISRSTTPGSSV